MVCAPLFSQNSGSTRKNLNIRQNADQSYMFAINFNDNKNNSKSSVAVPVSPAEMAVIRRGERGFHLI